MLKVTAGALKQFIREALDGNLTLESWTGMDGMPSKPDNSQYPVDQDGEVPIDPKMDHQAMEVSNLPVDDPKWCPRDRKEFGLAMKQLSEHVPESQFEYVWARIKNIIDKALENSDMTRTPPKIEDIDTSLAPQTAPEEKPKLQA